MLMGDMERLIPKIRDIAERIKYTEGQRKKLADFLKGIGESRRIVFPSGSMGIDGLKVVGIDGGIAKRSLHGFDCVLVRSVATCFSYRDGRVEKVEYIPSRMPVPEADIIEALSDLDWSYFTSTMRQSSEVRTALEALERFRPDILLMDGSVVSHYSDRPSRTSPIYPYYRKLLDLYGRLYAKALEGGTIVAGVIEDSRGISFCSMIDREIMPGIEHPILPEVRGILQKTRDTNLLYWVLDKGERTAIFPYSEKPEEHPVLKEFGDLGKKISSFYIKTAAYDRPIRVDFIAEFGQEGEMVEKLSSILMAISGHHSGYGLPAPLIEADNVAKMSDNEIDNFYTHILSFAGNIPSIMRLRREQRPF
jgi:hypothetical protein